MMRLPKLVGIILTCLILLVMGCIGCGGEVAPPGPENTTPATPVTPVTIMSIRGVVHDYRSGGTVGGGIEVRLYTYKKPDLPQLPPVGDITATTITEEGPRKWGKYQFEDQLDTLPQGCDKLVVFVDSGTEGYQVVEVAPGMIQVDLTKWSPALLITMTVTGVVTYRGNGAPATGIGVGLYTYDPNLPSESFPIDRAIKIDSTTEQGEYRLEVDEYVFRELTKLGHNKLIVAVFATPVVERSWKVIDLAEGTIEADLVTVAPVPSG